MPRPVQPLNGKQELFIRMTARGCSRRDVLKECFDLDIDTATEGQIHAADCKMNRLRKRPEFLDIWKDEVKQVLIAAGGKAYRTLASQIESKEAWLANKAANDVINHGRPLIFGDEEKAVNVRVTGMPDLGSPDQPEEDG